MKHQKKENNQEQKIKKQKLIKTIQYDKIKEGDIIIVECEKGKENIILSGVNQQLKPLIIEKNLRVLAVTPDFDTESLYQAVELVKSFKDE